MEAVLAFNEVDDAIDADGWGDLYTAPQKKMDKKARAMVQLAIEEELQSIIEDCKTTKEVWDTLEKLYAGSSITRRVHLRRKLVTLSLGDKSITAYVSEAKDTASQLRAAGYPVSEEEVAISILAGLPAEYDSVVTMMEGAGADASDGDKKGPQISVDKIQTSLLQLEQRLQERQPGRGSKNAGEAYMAAGSFTRSGFGGKPRRKPANGGECWGCGEPGHVKADCPNKLRGQRPQSRVVNLAFGAQHQVVRRVQPTSESDDEWVYTGRNVAY